ncbi:MAG: hypothetical protein ACRC7H_10985 [Plesiomonas shigelloides]
MCNIFSKTVLVYVKEQALIYPFFLQLQRDLEEILTEFRNENLDLNNSLTIVARRRKILHSACVALEKSHFDWHKMPNVEFVGEMADDYGGPRREFFR